MKVQDITPPEGFEWRTWVDRWDRMQARYLVRRAERFATIVRIVRATQGPVARILDLGCGPGTLMQALLDAFPQAWVCGIDFDPMVLYLAEKRLARYGERAQLVVADFREDSWYERVRAPLDGVVSATALQWLLPEQLEAVYHQLAQMLRPGGLFLNADHVGSEQPSIQGAWEEHRAEMRTQEGNAAADDWDEFWAAYADALGLDVRQVHQRIVGDWEGGVEEGLPLSWHLDALRQRGFGAVDCFWRCDCDAIYGGVRDSRGALE
jgi:SAM-dependent methyltransferase